MGVSTLTNEVTKGLGYGSRVFFEGTTYTIVGETGRDWILCGESFNKAFGVGKSRVEPLARDMFKIGEYVRSKHTFRGRVVGFEEETNRVVVVSDKIGQYTDRFEPGDGDRVRYSYKVTELFPVCDFVFQVNRVYSLHTISHEHVVVRALGSPLASVPATVTLYRVDNGEFFRVVPQECDAYELRRRGIVEVCLHGKEA